MLKLEKPHESHREMYGEMIQEWGSMEQIPTSPSALFFGNGYKDFLDLTFKRKAGKYGRVPSSLFFLIDREQILGAIDIRHNINHPKLHNGGHIGYGIRPSERKKGYATEILRLGLIEAKKIGIEKVLISCEPDNIASEKVILKNGGVYEKTVQNEYGIFKRHWINL